MFKEFVICQVFSKIETGKINAKANDFPEKKQGEFIIPLLTAGIQNQGLSRYAKREQCPTILKNVLSVSANGANSGAVFYQPDEFAVLQDAYAIQPINHEIYNEAEGLFLATILNKAIRESHDWSNKAGWNNIKDDLVSLPAKEDGTPDWDYMAKYIKKYEVGCINGLDSYLTNTGLGDYKLIDVEKELLVSKPRWKEFLMEDIFNIVKGKRLTKEDQLPGNTLFIGATAENHGQTARIGQAPLFPANTITVSYNGSVGEAFYQDEPYWASDDINVLFLKGYKLNRAIASYLCAVIRKAGKLFYYNQKWNLERMKVTKISLPLDINDNPDWDYMERYIRATEKLVIANAVRWKDKMIETTKAVMQ